MQAFRRIIQGWLGKSLLGIIILIFGAFGTQALLSIAARPKPALEVDGEQISQQALDRIISLQKQNLLARMGAHADPNLLDAARLRKDVIQALIDRSLLKEASRQQNLVVSEEYIKKTIMGMPQFQDNGQFSEALFKKLVEQYGYTPAQFLSELASDYQINQWRDVLTSSSFMTSLELKKLFELEKQTRDIAYLEIPTARYSASITQPTAEQLSHYYQAHSKNFMTEEQAKVNFIQLNFESYLAKVQVNEVELQQAYEQKKAEVSKADQEQRRAAHILLMVDATHSEAQVRQQLLALKQRIDQGENFAQVAQKYSQDPGSAAQGGDLGFAGRGVYDPSFEAALYSLKTAGEISPIVKSAFGLHLIQLKEIKKTSLPTFAELKNTLRQTLLTQKAEALYQEARSSLEEKAFEAGDLKALADEFSLPVQHSDWLKRSSANVGLFANPKLMNAAFSSAVLTEQRNSDVVDLDEHHSVVLRLVEHRASVAKPLTVVAPQVTQLWIQEQAEAKANKIGQTILSQLRSGTTRQQITAQYGVSWKSYLALKRGSDVLNAAVIDKTFALPRPSAQGAVYDQVILNGVSGSAIVGLLAVKSGQDLPLKAQEQQQVQRFLEVQLGERDFNHFMKYAKDRADIKIN